MLARRYSWIAIAIPNELMVGADHFRGLWRAYTFVFALGPGIHLAGSDGSFAVAMSPTTIRPPTLDGADSHMAPCVDIGVAKPNPQ
jgi:hypothetical protein